MFLFSILCCVLNVCEFLELVWKLLKRCDCRYIYFFNKKISFLLTEGLIAADARKSTNDQMSLHDSIFKPVLHPRLLSLMDQGRTFSPISLKQEFSVSRLEGNYEDNHFDNRPLLGEKRNRFVKRSASGMKSPTSSTAHEKQQDKG